MSDTPRTDALVKSHPETSSLDELADSYNGLFDFARQLERELAKMTEDRNAAVARFKEAESVQSATGTTVGTLEIGDRYMRDTIPAFRSLPNGTYELRRVDRTAKR